MPEDKPPNLVQRILRFLRPGSTELQDAIAEDITFDRSKVDDNLKDMLHSARRLRRASDSFIVAAELLVKDFKPEKPNAKSVARTKKP
jgi:hypothetical protein